MKKELPHATVQYGDMHGTAAADWHMKGFHDLAKAKGMDTERYFPVALDIYGFTPDSVKIYAVDTQVVGRDNFPRYAGSHGGRLPVVVFSVPLKKGELDTYIKRFSVVLISRMGEEIEAFEELDQVQL